MNDLREFETTSRESMVAGWLLALCLILCFVYPGSVLYALGTRTIPNLIRTANPERILLLSVYSVLFALLAAFSLVAGLKLWLVKPGAVQFAKRFLLTTLLANVAYFLFWIGVARPTQPVSFAEMGWYHVVGPIGSTVLWYLYLELSKRVRITYSTE